MIVCVAAVAVNHHRTTGSRRRIDRIIGLIGYDRTRPGPGLSSLYFLDIVHTTGVVEAEAYRKSRTGGVADSKNGAVPAGTLFSVANVIVCTVVVITGGMLPTFRRRPGSCKPSHCSHFPAPAEKP